jgi:glutathione peroxidase
MKVLLITLASAGFMLSCGTSKRKDTPNSPSTISAPMEKKSIHEFTVTDIDGNPFSFLTLKGKKIMVVNTASKCGLTPQYKSLEALYQQYKDSSFVIIGFPANNFMGQEPGSNEEIAAFCSKNYGVSFPMMSKISVKGNDMHPVYQFLTSLNQNALEDNDVKWNFQKYLLDENGFLVRVIDPSMQPDDPTIVQWIKAKG